MDGPYVGPSPFGTDKSKLFFGRSEEIRDLRVLLRTERIVVLHSPSGAGKTSLIQAGLVPRLADEHIHVLPTIRINSPLPEAHSSQANRYAYSVIRSIEQSGGERLSGIRLADYFEHRAELHRDDRPILMIFDQFEEIFTTDSDDHRGRLDFFVDLAEVLCDKRIWALFAMREEYVASLDSYKRLVPAHFSGRFHLGFLGRKAAHDAIAEPARLMECPFKNDDLVGDLLNDLAGVDARTEPSHFDVGVDPLHLQLTCSEIWKRRDPNMKVIDAKAVGSLGPSGRSRVSGLTSVGAALKHYYDDTILRAAASSGCEEFRIRIWIDDALIHSDSHRQMAQAAEPGLDEAASYLDADYILRAVFRGETRWYEVAHDRLVKPIRASNDGWYQRHLPRFRWRARQFRARGRPRNFAGVSKREWRPFAEIEKSDPGALDDSETEYLNHCRRINKRRVNAASIGMVLALLLVAAAVLNREYLRQKAEFLASIDELRTEKQALESQRSGLEGQISSLEDKRAELESTNARLKDAKRKGDAQLESTQDKLEGVTVEAVHSKAREDIRRLQILAMRERERGGGDDRALLLAKIAAELNAEITDPNKRLPTSTAHFPIWAAAVSAPFTQTLPAEILGGGVLSIEAQAYDEGVRLLVQNDTKTMALTLPFDPGTQLASSPVCENGPQSLSPRGNHVVILGAGHATLRNAQDCDAAALHRLELATRADRLPVWHPNGTKVFLFTAGGGAKSYSLSNSRLKTEVSIPPPDLARWLGEQGDRSDAITHAAYWGDILAVGTANGLIKLFSLGQATSDTIDPIWFEEWRLAEHWRADGLRTFSPESAGVVGMALLKKVPEIKGPVLAVAHRGISSSGGGRIFLHALSTSNWEAELVGDEADVQESIPFFQASFAGELAFETYRTARFSPENHWLVTAGDRGTVIYWDLQTLSRMDFQAQPKDLSGEGATANVLGDSLAALRDPFVGAPSGSVSKELKVAAERDVFHGLRTPANAVFATPGGESVLAASEKEVRIWRTLPRQGRVTQSWADKGDYLYGLAFDSREDSGDHLVTSHNKSSVQGWEIVPLASESGVVIHKSSTVPGSYEGIFPLTEVNRSIRRLALNGHHMLLAMGPANRAAKGPGMAVIRDLRDGSLEVALGGDEDPVHPDGLWGSAFRPNNPSFQADWDVATGDYSGKLILWDIEEGADERLYLDGEPESLQFSGSLRDVAFHPGGRWLAVATRVKQQQTEHGWDGRVYLVDLKGQSCEIEGDGVGAPCIVGEKSPDGGTFASVSGSALTVAFSNNRLAVAGDRGVVYWWNFDPDAPLDFPKVTFEQDEGAPGSIESMRFLGDDSQTVVTAGGSGVQLWPLSNPPEPAEALGEDGAAWQSVAVNPAGTLVAAGDSLGRFSIWHLIAPEEVCDLVLRDLTLKEWNDLIGPRLPRRRVCANHPDSAKSLHAAAFPDFEAPINQTPAN